VHIISIGGTSFRRYLELARLLENRVAALRITTAIISRTAWIALQKYSVRICRYSAMKILADQHFKYACIRTTLPSVCSFISEHLGIRIESHRKDETQVELITCQHEATTLHADDEVIKHFYQ